MKRLGLAVAASAALAGMATAAEIDLAVENFFVERGITIATVKVTNNTSKLLGTVMVECAFLNGEEKALDVGNGIMTNIRPGESAYDNVRVTRTEGIEFTSCRISNILR